MHAISMHFIRISQNWRNRKRDSRYIIAGPICRSYSTRSIPLPLFREYFFPRSVVNFSLQIFVVCTRAHVCMCVSHLYPTIYIEKEAAITSGKLSSD